MPLNLVAFVHQHLFFIHQTHEPLPRRDKFQRLLPFLIEFDIVRQGLWFALQRSAFRAGGCAVRIAQQFFHDLFRGFRRFADKLGVIGVRGVGIQAFPAGSTERHREQMPVQADNLAQR